MRTKWITTHVDSETLHLPELQPFIGRTVDLLIVDRDSLDAEEPDLSFFTALASPRRPATAEELRELHEAARTDPALAAALEIAAKDSIDADAIARLRAASML